jgi:acetyl esterase
MPLHPLLAAQAVADQKAGRRSFCEGTVAQARASIAASCAALGPGPQVRCVRDVTIAARNGSVPGRLYLPQAETLGLVVYLHGGGWVAGTLDGSDALARNLALRSSCAVLLVDYRLAPEHPFPCGLEDAQDALRWAQAECTHLAGARVPLVVAGDSAGANLATVAATLLKDEVALALQLLFYPVTDTDPQTASYREFAHGLRLTRADMLWFMAHYAPAPLWPDPRISPLRSQTLEGSPAAWIATAEYDVLRDEGEAYAQRLRAAGVRVDLTRYPGLTHGFARMMNVVDAADRALGDAAAAIVAACAARPLAGAIPQSPPSFSR